MKCRLGPGRGLGQGLVGTPGLWVCEVRTGILFAEHSLCAGHLTYLNLFHSQPCKVLAVHVPILLKRRLRLREGM